MVHVALRLLLPHACERCADIGVVRWRIGGRDTDLVGQWGLKAGGRTDCGTVWTGLVMVSPLVRDQVLAPAAKAACVVLVIQDVGFLASW